MLTLRLILLILGATLIAGLWLWGRTRRSRRNRMRPTLQRNGNIALESRPVPPATEDDVDYEAALADLNGLMREHRRETPITGSAEPSRRRPPRRRHPAQMDLAFDEGSSPDTARRAPQRIIALYVRGRDGAVFEGPDLQRALASVDMRYGELSIFHHYGVGDTTSAVPLFSAANMFEPGAFDLDGMDTFTTPGLAIFMQVPNPADPAVAFELMLNTAQRLAQTLGGEVLDNTHQPLTAPAIEQLRVMAKDHERRRP